jgi:hypothetical protein
VNKKIIIFKAKTIITMNSYLPEANHVAVRDGKILGVGSFEDLQKWGEFELNHQFSDKVLLPGFVEGHCHAPEGQIWDNPYLGFFGRRDPEGKWHPDLKNMDEVLERLMEVERSMEDPEETLFAWGFDPIYYRSERMNVKHLDSVSKSRLIIIMHASGHLINVNSLVLERAGIDASTEVPGVFKDENCKPTGELISMATHYMIQKVAGTPPFFNSMDARGLRRFAASACNVGVTTATDLAARFDEVTLKAYREVTAKDDFRLRIAPAMRIQEVPIPEGIAQMRELKTTNTNKLHFGLCKIIVDGSIQGFTARLKWPGYFNGSPEGAWYLPPESLERIIDAYHAEDMHLHIHTNGDEATEVTIDALEAALNHNPRVDHRHTLQHCQMAEEVHFRRMGKLGICVNLFSNHLFYWGDQHLELTMGPDRAARMDATASAKRHGVNFSIHSDAPVTPLAPLFTAWCAVNRKTASGHILGEHERISVTDALHAITIGAAYTLKLDHLVGSIESGKFADFAVLEENPYEVAPELLKDMQVWGTVVDGIPFQAV